MPVRCDIHNPLPGGRTIYDGIGNKEPIHIPAGQTKTGVILSETTVKMLRDRVAEKPGSDLLIKEVEQVDPAAARKELGLPPEEGDDDYVEEDTQDDPAPKRGPGRPRKPRPDEP